MDHPVCISLFTRSPSSSATWLTGVSSRYAGVPQEAPRAILSRDNVKFEFTFTSESDSAFAHPNVESAHGVCAELGPITDHCPAIHKKILGVDSKPFQFYCGRALLSPGCAANPKCKGMDINWKDRKCYLKSHYVPVPEHQKSDANCAIPIGRATLVEAGMRSEGNRGHYQSVRPFLDP